MKGIDDRELDVKYVGKQCWYCIHIKSVLTGKCMAFDRIPEKILEDKVKHNNVIQGQKGNFVYKRRKK